MKPRTTFIIIALLVVGLFVYWGFERREEVEREQYYQSLTNAPKPTSTPTPLPNKSPTADKKGSLYYNQAGEIFTSENVFDGEVGKIRIDRIAFYFDDWIGGTYSLKMSLEGQLISGNTDFCLRYKLYDENDFVVDDGTFKIDGLEEGDKFKNEEIAVYDLENIGTYTIKIMNYE